MSYNPTFEAKVRAHLRTAYPDVEAVSWIRGEGFAAFVIRNESDEERVMEIITDPRSILRVTRQTATRIEVTTEGYER
jgi:hypothetical protein